MSEVRQRFLARPRPADVEGARPPRLVDAQAATPSPNDLQTAFAHYVSRQDGTTGA